MPTSQGQFWATIVCEGEKLKEYIQKPDKSTPEHIQRFVESHNGKQFQVEWGCSASQGSPFDYYVQLFIDGRSMKKRHLCSKGSKFGCIEGVKSPDRTSIAPFQFAKIETCESDDEAMMISDEALKELGTIRLVFTRCILKKRKSQYIGRTGSDIKKVGQVKLGEKSKKLSSEMTSYGPAKKIKARLSRYIVASADPKPFLTITFHYLSGALLELRGIKPDSTEATNLNSATSSSENLAPSTSSKSKSKSSSSHVKSKSTKENSQANSESRNSPGPSNVKPKVPNKRKYDGNSKEDVIILEDESSDEDQKPVVVHGGKSKSKKVKK